MQYAKTKPNNLPLIIIFIIGIIPFELNGLYNPIIVNYPIIYWSMEVISWVILPIVLIYFAINIKLIKLNEIGFKATINENSSRDNDRLLFVFLLIIVPIILKILYSFSYDLAHKIFKMNYGNSNFSYYSVLPKYGFRRVVAVLYYSITAAFVEEIYFRGLLYKLINNNSFLYLLISSILFASTHWEGGIYNIISTFIFGLTCSLIYLKFKNLWPLVFGHFITDYIIYIR